MKRVDLHSPSNFVAGDYEFQDFLYQGPANDDNWAQMGYWRDLKERTARTIERQGFKGNWYDRRTCDHCGANFYYGAIFVHTPSGDFVVVGQTCADETFGPNAERANKLKRLKAVVAEGRARGRRQAVAEDFQDQNPGLREALALADKHHILADLKEKLYKYGPLSERQVELALKIPKQIAEREAEAKVPCVAGKRSVSGTIVAARRQDGPYGEVTKMLVKLDTGEKFWGTMPSAVRWEANDAGLHSCIPLDAMRGRAISFTATFEVSQTDPCFGVFRRPTKAILN